MRFRTRRSASEWLALGEASRLLGVAPGTLRRWSDMGQVPAFTTPGGHRRYRRAALEGLLPRQRIARPSLINSGMTASRLARVYRQEARRAARGLPWIVELNDEQRDWFRHHGRRLAEALLGHLDAPHAAGAESLLDDAAVQAAEYGRVTSDLGVSLSQAVEGFLQFRQPFLHQLALVTRRRGLDATATTELMGAAERAMDRLLVAAMAGHSTHGGRHGNAHAIESRA
jgi:excisionase family DNA binding protein